MKSTFYLHQTACTEVKASYNIPPSLCPDEPSPDFSFQSQLMVPNQVLNADSSPETSPIRPLPRSASTANLQSASKLILSSKLVYSKRLDLPHGVEVTRATPSAGWERHRIVTHMTQTILLLPNYKECVNRKCERCF